VSPEGREISPHLIKFKKMKIRNPTKRELKEWRKNTEKYLLYLFIIERMYEEGIITGGQKRKLTNQLDKKFMMEHVKLNPFIRKTEGVEFHNIS